MDCPVITEGHIFDGVVNQLPDWGFTWVAQKLLLC